MVPVSRWLGAFVLAAVAAAQQPGSLVVQVQGETRAIDLASGAVGQATGEVPRQPPPLQRRMHGMDYASIPTQAVFSPDGTRVAHVLRTFDTAAAKGEIVVTDVHGDHAVEVTNDGGDNEDPLWSADGPRLLFSSRPPSGRRRKEGGRDLVALAEVPDAKAPADAAPRRRHIVVGNDPRLLGFVAAPAAAATTRDAEDAKPKR